MQELSDSKLTLLRSSIESDSGDLDSPTTPADILRALPGLGILLRVLLVVNERRWLIGLSFLALTAFCVERAIALIIGAQEMAQAFLDTEGASVAAALFIWFTALSLISPLGLPVGHLNAVLLVHNTTLLHGLIQQEWHGRPGRRARGLRLMKQTIIAMLFAASLSFGSTIVWYVIFARELPMDAYTVTGNVIQYLISPIFFMGIVLFVLQTRLLLDVLETFLLRVQAQDFDSETAVFDAYLRVHEVMNRASNFWRFYLTYYLLDMVVFTISFLYWQYSATGAVSDTMQSSLWKFLAPIFGMMAILFIMLVACIIVVNVRASTGIRETLLKSGMFDGPRRVALVHHLSAFPATFRIFGLELSPLLIKASFVALASAGLPLVARSMVQ